VTINGRSEPASALAEYFDRVPICIGGSGVVREVVVEAGVDHAVRCRGAARQTFQIIKRSSMYPSAGGGK